MSRLPSRSTATAGYSPLQLHASEVPGGLQVGGQGLCRPDLTWKGLKSPSRVLGEHDSKTAFFTLYMPYVMLLGLLSGTIHRPQRSKIEQTSPMTRKELENFLWLLAFGNMDTSSSGVPRVVRDEQARSPRPATSSNICGGTPRILEAARSLAAAFRQLSPGDSPCFLSGRHG